VKTESRCWQKKYINNNNNTNTNKTKNEKTKRLITIEQKNKVIEKKNLAQY